MSDEPRAQSLIRSILHSRVVVFVFFGCIVGYLVGAYSDSVTPGSRSGGIACGLALAAFLGWFAGKMLDILNYDEYHP